MVNKTIEVISEPIDKDGQVTIPPIIREKLRLKTNDYLLFQVTNSEKLYIKKIGKLRYFIMKIRKMRSRTKTRNKEC